MFGAFVHWSQFDPPGVCPRSPKIAKLALWWLILERRVKNFPPTSANELSRVEKSSEVERKTSRRRKPSHRRGTNTNWPQCTTQPGDGCFKKEPSSWAAAAIPPGRRSSFPLL